MITYRHDFEPYEMKEMMKAYKTKDPKDALEKWAYDEYCLAFIGDRHISRVGKTFVEVSEET